MVGPEAPRIARLIVLAVFFGYAVNTVNSTWTTLPWPQFATFVGCLVVLLPLQFLHSFREPLTWRAPTRLLTLTAQTLVTLVPLLWVGAQAAAMAGFLAGSMLLAVAGRVRWLLYAAVGVAVLIGLRAIHLGWVDILYGTYFTVLAGLMIFGISSLTSLVGLVFAGRGELARTAVARERVRIARDLHDLLGLNVSAIALRSQLVHRLLPGAPARAREELTAVLQVTRQSLADVRMVTSGSGPMSFAAEVESAESILAVADIEFQVVADPRDVPGEVENVLAVVLREATTNVLRHGRARHCAVRVRRGSTQIRLHVDSDGAEPDQGGSERPGSGERPGIGLTNLADRLAGVGGALTVAVAGQWFRLTAQVPLGDGSRRAPASTLDEAGLDDAAARIGRGRPWHLRVARSVAVAVTVGYAALTVVNVVSRPITVGSLIGFVACMAVQASVLIAYALGRRRRLPGRLRTGTLVLQLVAAALPLLWLDAPWGSMGGFLAGTVLLALPGRRGWLLFAAIGVAVAALAALEPGSFQWNVYLVISTLLTGLTLYGIGSLSSLVVQVNQTRDELARAAVARERLRLARDLDELLGRDLSQVAVACRSAHRHLATDPQLARTEMAAVLEVSHRALATVRAAASGYRYLSFSAELDSAASILEAAGVDLSIEASARPVPRTLDAVLSLALREAVANVLRHSDAARCRIRVCHTADDVRLDVTNDGAARSSDPVLESGSGLGDLAARVGQLGGRLVAHAHPDGTFELLIEIPTEPTETEDWERSC
ncbi:sensor histidine kinase [Cryptosporangium arvum]|uniref:Signal transduction histidine kinase n=1 Tax=Cryptosporangium arvum DSM 44712 TaxID=927661 RepID=A0A010ZYY7_9ACTN|nr:histidine kinase [Cryptosporangium arvum]EXG82427.1 signal transduction histidine kinase [Cryptosporangium arvum DSM 44712]